MNTVQAIFEDSFSSRGLDLHIKLCENDEMVPLMLDVLYKNQPVLEAGCGSGKWMHYLKKHNITATGIDWSTELQSLSIAYDTTVQFDVGDLRQLPYNNESFGSIIALGSIEHVVEGPGQTLRELHRVLKVDGIGIITVPYYSTIRKISYMFSYPLRLLRRCNLVRRVTKKLPLQKKDVPGPYRKDVYQVLSTANASLVFYEYQFTTRQFSDELRVAGFTVNSISGNSLDEGILHTFGRVVGKWDATAGRVNLNYLGLLIRRFSNPDNCGHMLCAIVKK